MLKSYTKKVEKVDKNKLKCSCIETIQRNYVCIEFLENLQNKLKNHVEDRQDEINIQILDWALFNIKYNTDMVKDTFKELGGNPHAIKPFKWE